jgi:hypothetical protein
VDAGSAAERAQVCLGDELLSLEHAPLNGLAEVRRRVASLSLTQPTALLVQRGGARLALWAQAQSFPVETLPVGRVELDEVPCGNHRLRAVWTLPDAAGPHPTIWLLPGATWLSEERSLPPGGSLLELVRGFTRAGFATLRVDRSGLGDSEGPLCTELDLDAELADWRMVQAYLFSHRHAKKDGVFLYARSLGGMLAPLLAQSGLFRAIAVWGSSAERWDRCMLEATRRQYLLAGRTGVELEHTLEQLARLTAWIYEHGLTPEQAFNREPELRNLQSESFVQDRVYGRSARFFQQLRAEDVAAAWRTVQRPVLALHGAADWLGFSEHSARIAELAPHGRWQELTGIDHMMHARATLAEAFAEPFSGVFDPQALDALVAFYREHA